MAVQVKGDINTGVSENLTDYLGIYTAGKHISCITVSEVVETDIREVMEPEKCLEIFVQCRRGKVANVFLCLNGFKNKKEAVVFGK